MAEAAESSSRSNRVRKAVAAGVGIVIIILLLRLCGPGGPGVDVSGGPETPPAVGIGPPTGEPPLTTGPLGPDGLPAVEARGGPAGSRRLVGYVAALLGNATAQPASASPRRLACWDPIWEGDRLLTEPNARLGVLAADDQVYLQLDNDTALLVGLTDQAALDLSLQTGSARILDPRESGPAGRVRVGDAEAALLGNDVEAYSGNGDGGMLCALSGTLPVLHGGTYTDAARHGCVVAATGRSLQPADAPQERVSLPYEADEECIANVQLAASELYFPPTDVAAGPDERLIPPPFPDRPDRDPCDQPGVNCFAGLAGGGGGGGGGGGPGPMKVKGGWAVGPYFKGPPPDFRRKTNIPPGQIKKNGADFFPPTPTRGH